MMPRSGPRYCFDTSAFIGAWIRHYPLDHFPALWDRISELAAADRLVVSDEVVAELERQHDALYEWVRQLPCETRVLDEDVQNATREILRQFPRMLNTKGQRPTADPFIVGCAVADGCVLVTEEGPSGTTKRAHIPDVCQALGIRCVNLLEFIRSERLVFR